MFLPAKNGHPAGKWFNRNFAFVTVLTFVFYAVLSVRSTAQIPKSASPKAEPASPVDPLRRETPRSAVEGLLRCAEREDFACAARYLQPPPDQQVDMLKTAREFQALHARYKGSIAGLSDDPNGRVEEGLPSGQEWAGVINLGDTTTEVILTRVDDPNCGKIWLISGETVAQIPQLYAELQKEKPTLVERMTPAALAKRHFLGVSLALWLGCRSPVRNDSFYKPSTRTARRADDFHTSGTISCSASRRAQRWCG